tara:strand:+ start:245 stop:856 length:612 start_codon:yes stop_codon:yes gene_type:complete
MSYSNTLNANANMYTKAKIMLEGDIQKKRYNRGLSKSMANKEASDQLISDKIQQIIGEKRDIANELSRDFNRNLSITDEKEDSLKSLRALSKNQDKEISYNQYKLENLRNDILTIRRQIETTENEHQKKSFLVFFLKNTFIYLLAVILVTLLVKNGNISVNISKKIHVGLLAILAVICFIHLWRNRYQHTSVMNKQNFYLPRK